MTDTEILKWGTDNIVWAGNAHTNQDSRKEQKPLMIVDHMSMGSKSSCISWFTSPGNKNSSAHFLVGLDGSVYQFVSIYKNAWGNGLTAGMANATSELVHEMGQNISVNRYSVSIEHEGGIEDYGDLSTEQLNSSILLHKFIIAFVKKNFNHTIEPTRKFIVGHYEINKRDKMNCPGSAFPFTKIIAALGGKTENLPFDDIYEHWAKDLILEAVSLGLVSGRSGSKNFFPDDRASRAESITLIVALYHKIKEEFEEVLKEISNSTFK